MQYWLIFQFLSRRTDQHLRWRWQFYDKFPERSKWPVVFQLLSCKYQANRQRIFWCFLQEDPRFVSVSRIIAVLWWFDTMSKSSCDCCFHLRRNAWWTESFTFWKMIKIDFFANSPELFWFRNLVMFWTPEACLGEYRLRWSLKFCGCISLDLRRTSFVRNVEWYICLS